MKNSIKLFIVTIVAVLAMACAPLGAKEVGYTTITIESCEYIEVKAGHERSAIYSLTHKGTCPNPIHKKDCK